jgi:hypothetical protein
MAIITIIMNLIIGHTPLAEVAKQALVRSIHTGFIIFAIICILGVFISLNRKGSPGGPPK